MSTQVHITLIEESWANVKANIDHGQHFILNDTASGVSHDAFGWVDDSGDKIYLGAAQKYWSIGGAAFTYLDAEFDKLTVYDTTDGLIVAKYIRHYDDTDTLILFHDDTDRIQIQAGGVTMLDLIEDGTQDIVEVNPGNADVDFVVNASGLTNALFVRGSDGIVEIGDTGAPTWDTSTYDVLSVGDKSGMAAAGSPLYLCNDVYYDTGNSRWEIVTGGYASALVTIAEGITIDVDANYHSGAPDDALSAMELFHATATGVAVGEFVINDDSSNVDFRVESDGLTHALFVDASENEIGIGTASADVFVHVERETATTDAVQYLLRLTETCSDTVTDGFGVGMQFELENATQATNYVAGSIAVLWEDDSDRDSDMVIQLMDADTLAEVARFTSDGKLYLSNDGIDWSANQITAFGVVDGNAGQIGVWNNSTGAIAVQGYTQADAVNGFAVLVRAFVENDPSDEGAFHLIARKHDGAGAITDIGDAGIVFSIENNATDLLKLRGEGSLALLGQDVNDVSYAVPAAGKYRLLHVDENGDVVVGDNDKNDLST